MGRFYWSEECRHTILKKLPKYLKFTAKHCENSVKAAKFLQANAGERG